MRNISTGYRSYFDPLLAVLTLIGIGFAVRLILAGTIGLGVDESYVVTVSRSFSLSYFDHPPLHFWLVRTAALLFGSEHPVILRLPFILLFAGTTWLMYSLTARLFNERAGFYAALLMNLSAVFSLSTGSWVLPDGPLMFFMLAAVSVLTRILFDEHRQPSLALWLLFGILTGLGMLSKYHAVFLLAGLFAFLVTSSHHRSLLAAPGPYLAVMAAFLVFSPVLIWNTEHGWISFLFHGGRAVSKGFSPGSFAANIAGQAIWVLPWIWLPLAWTFIRNIVAGPECFRKNTIGDRSWLLCCLAAGPIVLFTIATLWGAQGLFHWQAPGYLLVFPLLGNAAAERSLYSRRLVNSWIKGSTVIFLLVVSLLASHTATGWLQDTLPDAFPEGDPTLESLNWNDLPLALREQGYLSPATKGKLFVAANNWIDAGKIGYALGGSLPVVNLSNEPHHFPFMLDLAELKGKDALIIGRDKNMLNAADEFKPYFDSIARVGEITLSRYGRQEMTLVVFYARNFHGEYPLPYGQKNP